MSPKILKNLSGHTGIMSNIATKNKLKDIILELIIILNIKHRENGKIKNYIEYILFQ